MDSERQLNHEGADSLGPAILDIGEASLSIFLIEAETFLLRPIESWDENGKKRSRVNFGIAGLSPVFCKMQSCSCCVLLNTQPTCSSAFPLTWRRTKHSTNQIQARLSCDGCS